MPRPHGESPLTPGGHFTPLDVPFCRRIVLDGTKKGEVVEPLQIAKGATRRVSSRGGHVFYDFDVAAAGIASSAHNHATLVAQILVTDGSRARLAP